MTTLIAACAGLVLLSAAFYLFPRRRGIDDNAREQANIEWLRLREAELAEEGNRQLDPEAAQRLRDDARLRLLEDDTRVSASGAEQGASRFHTWLLLPLVALLATGLYYQLGAASDVVIYQDMQTLDEAASEQERQQLITTIAARSKQRPDNLHYLSMLGRFYMNTENYAAAAANYEELVIRAPGDAQALAYAAQAEYLAADRTLGDTARLRAEQALAVDPHQRTALGLLGMASFEQGQYRAAIDYWERLLAMEVPGSQSASMIEGVIGRARTLAGAASVTEEAATDATAGITIEVALPADARLDPAATVFVLARAAGSDSRMPIAVQRFNNPTFPLLVRLDDSNSMAGQKLSQAEQVIVGVQVSADGRPGVANATWLIESEPIAPLAGQGEPLRLELRRNGS